MKLTERHLKCLRAASIGSSDGENETQLGVGDKTRQECFDWGLIEQTKPGWYRITGLGEDVLRNLPPCPPKKKLGIKTLKSQVKMLGPKVRPL